jgi:hypothetical protein
VNLVGQDGRLETRSVQVAFTQQDLAVIRSGLEGGETVVVSTLPYAVEGMLLDPVPDRKLSRRILAQARGGAAETPLEANATEASP